MSNWLIWHIFWGSILGLIPSVLLYALVWEPLFARWEPKHKGAHPSKEEILTAISAVLVSLVIFAVLASVSFGTQLIACAVFLVAGMSQFRQSRLTNRNFPKYTQGLR